MSRHADSHLAILLCFVLAVSFVSGCGGKGPKTSEAGGKTEITFWHSYVESTTPALERLLERFHAEHPDITVKAQYVPTGDQLLQKLTTAIVTGTAPDVCWIHSNWIPPLSRQDAVHDLGQLAAKYGGFGEEEQADFFEAPLRTSYYNDRLMMMPIEGTNLALAYNRDLFRKAGLDPDDPPDNWDEFVQYGKKLTVRKGGRVEQWACTVPVFVGTNAGWTVWQWMTFLWGWGGRYADPSGEKVAFDSPAGAGALQFWVDLQHRHKIGSMTAPDQGFESQRIAMSLMGPWDLPHLEDMTFDWAIAPMPAGPKEHVTSLGAEYLVIFKQSKHPDAAWEFIRWFITPDVQEAWSKDSNYLPIRRSVLDSPTYQQFLDESPAMRVFAEQMEYAYAESVLLPNANEIDLLLATAIEEGVRQVKRPKQALEDAARKANALLAESGD